ncbi:MAG: hypothetical protein ABI425_03395 [Patescibacteria group bacterium]
MLTQFFDFQLASYESVENVNPDEIAKADLIEIRGFVPGGIYHSQSLRWMGGVTNFTSPKEMIRSKKERSVLDENKSWFEERGYSFEIVPMTKVLFNEFYEVYQKTTLQRERALTFPLKEQILGKVLVKTPVFLIGMFKRKKLESALVFSVTEDKQAVVSFGAKKKFDERRGGVGGVLELLLIEYCLAHGLTEVSHGKSRNPAGITSKAGVFEFKARYGFSAFPEGYWKTTFILNPKIALSDLVFVTVLKNQVGYIVVSDDEEKKVFKKYRTREVSLIQQMSFAKAKRSARLFIRDLKKG